MTNEQAEVIDEYSDKIYYPNITVEMIKDLRAVTNFDKKLSKLRDIVPVLEDLRYGNCPYSIEQMIPEWDEYVPTFLSVDITLAQRLLAPFIALIEEYKKSPFYSNALIEHNEWKTRPKNVTDLAEITKPVT